MEMKTVTRLLYFVLALCATTAAADNDFTPANAQGQYRYLITFAEPGLVQRAGRAPESAAREALMTQQAEYRQAMDGALGQAVEVSHYYLATHSGMAAWLTPAEAGAVMRLPGVASVERERQYQTTTYRGPWFIGADALWNGDSAPDGTALRGEGMVLGIVDTGIDANHPSFADDPACGHGQGEVPSKLLSTLDCASTDAQGVCNGANPQDTNRHGTHVAGTAGGNRLDQTADPAPAPPGSSTEISGVAPCAHIRAYKVCPGDSCPAADIRAGLNNVLIHGDVDVVNFSISGGTLPWQDNDRIKLNLVEAGVFVAAASGNTGAQTPDPVGNVNHRGPWVLSVAASSHDGGGHLVGTLSATGPDEPPADTRDIPMTAGSESPVGADLGDHPIRHFADQPADFEGCTPGEDGAPADMAPFPDDFFAGAAALIQRGNCPFTKKIGNAFDAGADLVVVRNNESGSLSMDTTGQAPVPAYSIGQAAGIALAAFVDDHPDSATIDFTLAPNPGDSLADFSLRGPTPAPPHNLTKPDISAPGVDIYAAYPTIVAPSGYGFLSGTSMASPHVAGAAILVRQARPEWTVSEVKSALMMTASKHGTKEDGATAWDWDDVGSGRVELTRAALAGLVMDESFVNYLAADPALGGDVKTLNLPALRDIDCSPYCTWTRTLHNTLDQPTNWTASSTVDENFAVLISPAEFSFDGNPDETQQLTITVVPVGNQSAALTFSDIVLTENNELAPEQRITLAVSGTGPTGPVADMTPDNFQVTLQAHDSGQENLTLGNLGVETLNWSIAAGEIAAAVPASHHPALDERLALPDFELISPADDGEPVVLTATAGAATPGPVSGLTFSGTASNLTDSISWASDTCLIAEAPDGSRYTVGGNSGTVAGCGDNDWFFQGASSAGDGNYFSPHDGVFEPPVSDHGEWAFTFVNDWDNSSADPITWTDVAITLHKTVLPACDNPAEVSWLSVTPAGGATPPDAYEDITLAFDSSDLSPGVYGAALCFISDASNAELVVLPVVLTVEGDEQPPGNAIFRDQFELWDN